MCMLGISITAIAILQHDFVKSRLEIPAAFPSVAFRASSAYPLPVLPFSAFFKIEDEILIISDKLCFKIPYPTHRDPMQHAAGYL